MLKACFYAMWLILYNYYMEQIGTIQKGWGRRAALMGLGAALLMLSVWLPGVLAWLLVSGLMALYDLFFDEEPFRSQWWKVLAAGICFAAASAFPADFYFLANGPLLFLIFLFLAAKREYLRLSNGILTGILYCLFTGFLWLIGYGLSGKCGWEINFSNGLMWGGILMEALLFLVVEGTLFSYKKGFEFQTERFCQDVMGHQYEEIKSIYMNMRGWRHDYHNHLQVLKAQLALGNQEEAEQYLDELEQDLDRVDTYVKSGNLMVDAILNSKLSLAQQRQIAVNCKAQVPEELSVEDVDLCVILGNLLDNALEACEQIPVEQRFLRIYMIVNKSQLYLSVQNAAKEELDFDERNYITNKRGNHGFGMKRVKAVVDKYEGYLNLANEPGIFAAEVTMPLEDCIS
ncbi:MAG: GHKL domain-containing protein [Eubacteriales bacterium]|nr:GHKL domain-containing protein [Eubacteriales bacterium]